MTVETVITLIAKEYKEWKSSMVKIIRGRYYTHKGYCGDGGIPASRGTCRGNRFRRLRTCREEMVVVE
jgi:hypothetical protein